MFLKAGVWAKQESFYMTKSLANKLYLKKRFYTFNTVSTKSLEDHTDEFNKFISDLGNIEVKLDEYLAIIFLSSLPSTYEHVYVWKGNSNYHRRGPCSLNSKELKKRGERLMKGVLMVCLFEEDLIKGLARKGPTNPNKSQNQGALCLGQGVYQGDKNGKPKNCAFG